MMTEAWPARWGVGGRRKIYAFCCADATDDGAIQRCNAVPEPDAVCRARHYWAVNHFSGLGGELGPLLPAETLIAAHFSAQFQALGGAPTARPQRAHSAHSAHSAHRAISSFLPFRVQSGSVAAPHAPAPATVALVRLILVTAYSQIPMFELSSSSVASVLPPPTRAIFFFIAPALLFLVFCNHALAHVPIGFPSEPSTARGPCRRPPLSESEARDSPTNDML